MEPRGRRERNSRRPDGAGFRIRPAAGGRAGRRHRDRLGPPGGSLRREARDARCFDCRSDWRCGSGEGGRGEVALRRAHHSLRTAAPHQSRHLLHQRASRPDREGPGRAVQRDAGAGCSGEGLPGPVAPRRDGGCQRQSRGLHQPRQDHHSAQGSLRGPGAHPLSRDPGAGARRGPPGGPPSGGGGNPGPGTGLHGGVDRRDHPPGPQQSRREPDLRGLGSRLHLELRDLDRQRDPASASVWRGAGGSAHQRPGRPGDLDRRKARARVRRRGSLRDQRRPRPDQAGDPPGLRGSGSPGRGGLGGGVVQSGLERRGLGRHARAAITWRGSTRSGDSAKRPPSWREAVLRSAWHLRSSSFSRGSTWRIGSTRPPSSPGRDTHAHEGPSLQPLGRPTGGVLSRRPPRARRHVRSAHGGARRRGGPGVDATLRLPDGRDEHARDGRTGADRRAPGSSALPLRPVQPGFLHRRASPAARRHPRSRGTGPARDSEASSPRA